MQLHCCKVGSVNNTHLYALDLSATNHPTAVNSTALTQTPRGRISHVNMHLVCRTRLPSTRSAPTKLPS
jgi:hypothetical protein